MRREDITVEVRDRDLARQGVITSRYLQLTARVAESAVGTWEIALPGDHPMVPHLNAEGSGIIVTQTLPDGTPRVMFSGPTDKPTRKRDQQNVAGLMSFKGISDDIVLADALAFGDPARESDAQQTSNDTRTAIAETLMREYVDVNIGVGASSTRRIGLRAYVSVAVDEGRGVVITKSPRFQNLLELLQEIATLSALQFRVVQVDDALQFQVLDRSDRTALVRLDIQNGTLNSEEVEKSPPTLTRAYVAGQGEGVERTIVERTSVASVASESTWGRVIERWFDARDKSDLVELAQQGDEALATEGATTYVMRATTTDSTSMLYGADWLEGDVISVHVDGGERHVRVAAAAVVMNASGVLVGAAIGDISTLDEVAALEARVVKNEKRIDKVARNTDAVPPSAIATTPGTLARRDESGRFKVTDGVADDDVATVGQVNKIGSIPHSADLNDYTTTGVWHQNDIMRAYGGTNYPEAAAGLLEVFSVAGDYGWFVYQRYTTSADDGVDVFKRAYGGMTNWGPWEKLYEY